MDFIKYIHFLTQEYIRPNNGIYNMKFKNQNYNNKTQIYIPVSCLCSVYKETEKEEFILALKSLLIQKYIPNQIIIVLDES